MQPQVAQQSSFHLWFIFVNELKFKKRTENEIKIEKQNLNIDYGDWFSVGVKEDFYFPTEPLSVTTYIPNPSSGGGRSNKQNTIPAVLGATTNLKLWTSIHSGWLTEHLNLVLFLKKVKIKLT